MKENKKVVKKSLIRKSGVSLTGFKKSGQIKVSQNPDEGFKKLGENEKEYGVDDLVNDSVESEQEEEVTDAEHE